jgi:hypothetical protein
MYDGSSLTQYDSSIQYLYLYGNTLASFFGSSYMNTLWIDPNSTTQQVLLYARDVTFVPLNPPFEPYSEGRFKGWWIANDNYFQFDLIGNGAYSKVQIVPEPATFILFGLGCLAILKKRAR